VEASDAPSRGALFGRTVLVVEDNYLIAEHVCGVLENAGCTVLGPVARVGRGLELARAAAGVDGAVLDINLDGQLCFPVSEALAARAIPFIFMTGYDDRTIIPSEFRSAPVLAKPIDEAALIAVAATTFGAGAADGRRADGKEAPG
jgi:CheY-like chemotaxis protein